MQIEGRLFRRDTRMCHSHGMLAINSSFSLSNARIDFIRFD